MKLFLNKNKNKNIVIKFKKLNYFNNNKGKINKIYKLYEIIKILIKTQ